MSIELDEQEKRVAAKAAHLCACEERCASDMESKLTSWCTSPTSVNRIVQYLKEEGYIDERRYTKAFANGKLRQLKWGRTKIAYQLKMKRIDDHIIEEGLLELDEKEYREVLQKLVDNKWKTTHEADEFVKRGKITASLQSRGFEAYEIRNALDQVEK